MATTITKEDFARSKVLRKHSQRSRDVARALGAKTDVLPIRADRILTHPADSILTQGGQLLFDSATVDKCTEHLVFVCLC
jgi:hypothetical protein